MALVVPQPSPVLPLRALLFVNCCWCRIFHVGTPGLFQPCFDDLICFSHPPWGVRAGGRRNFVFCFCETFCTFAGASGVVGEPQQLLGDQPSFSLLV